MARRTTAALLAAFALAANAVAADKDDKKADDRPLGTWARKLPNDVVVTFKIEADKMVCEVVTPNGESVTAHGAYGVADGVLFGVINKVEKKGTDGGPNKGELFGFNFKLAKDTLTISDYRGSVERADAKELVEGEYKKK